MTNVKLKIKKGDKVRVIAGDDKGKEGIVSLVLPKKNAVLIEGMKLAKKTVKASEENPKGGFKDKEMLIHISNIKKVEGE